ncbi:related to MSS116 - RNA helicase of the DEAD box family, mitochondrial [Ustilago trichophora]|uniref:ATP-dependent RNA helicase n=1 Tax=Ustilago trichophora TaxID=86804 RepID=A0A5C3E8Y2_9BASI|nr:related to MSS116 - RNA helicase of the DEAD box family, mitochondrial [Ustilago trichophora]
MESNSLANRLGPQEVQVLNRQEAEDVDAAVVGVEEVQVVGTRRGGRGGGAAARWSGTQPASQVASSVDATPDETPAASGTSTPTWTPKSIAPGTDAAVYLTENRFADLKGSIDDRLLSAIPSRPCRCSGCYPFHRLSGKDVLAQAKTDLYSVLVLSPTRELALQIEKEAQMLLANLQGTFSVQHVVGGTNISAERKRLQRDRKDLLIATPARSTWSRPSQSLPESESSRSRRGRPNARHGLPQRARKDPQDASRPRCQSAPVLFFSATSPLCARCRQASPDHAFISTLTEQDTNTHEHVPQNLTFALFAIAFHAHSRSSFRKPFDTLTITNSRLLAHARSLRSQQQCYPVEESEGSPYAKLGPIFEIHSRKSQAVRTKTMETSRQCFGNPLLLRRHGSWYRHSRYLARLQLGLPSSLEQYIHRLGRTARAGKEGRGVLILADFEQFFLNQADVKKLPITKLMLPRWKLRAESTYRGHASGRWSHAEHRSGTRSQAYQAHLGFYKSYLKQLKWKPRSSLLRQMMACAQDGSWVGPPLLQKTVSMMGLKGKSGLNVVRELPGKPHGGGRGGADNGLKRQGQSQGVGIRTSVNSDEAPQNSDV